MDIKVKISKQNTDFPPYVSKILHAIPVIYLPAMYQLYHTNYNTKNPNELSIVTDDT